MSLRTGRAGAPVSGGEHSGPIPIPSRKELRRLSSELRRTGRKHPVVVLSVEDGSERSPFEAETISAALGPEVAVYLLPSTYMARRLAEAIGPELAVEGGAARIFWPGPSPEGNPADHPLVEARGSDGRHDALERLLDAFELSRPRVRRQLAPIEQRLERVERQAAESLRALARSRAEREKALTRAKRAESALSKAEEQLRALAEAGLDEAERVMLACMDSEQRMHRLISTQWIRSLTATDRRAHPLGRYVFGPRFIESASRLSTPLDRIAFVCAMVACSRARSMPGIEPHQLRADEGGAASQEVRSDGAKAWTCKLSAGPGGSRLAYWVTSEGLTEFAAVGLHDEIGRR